MGRIQAVRIEKKRPATKARPAIERPRPAKERSEKARPAMGGVVRNDCQVVARTGQASGSTHRHREHTQPRPGPSTKKGSIEARGDKHTNKEYKQQPISRETMWLMYAAVAGCGVQELFRSIPPDFRGVFRLKEIPTRPADSVSSSSSD